MNTDPVLARWGLLAILTVAASPAMAGDVASEFGLGTIHGFTDEGTARAGCGGDAVVWADRRTGFYYPKFAPEYGKSPTGSFACYKQAKAAEYWGLGGGTEAMAAGGRGRVFPFNPEPDCDYKVDKTTGKGFCAEPGT